MGVRLAVGEEFAGHRIERLIGRGGMGVVYVAEHLRLGRKVAIKVLDPDLAGDENARQRFIRESRLAAALEHRNIVQIYDAGELDGVAYISMQLVNGMDLAALLRAKRTLPPGRTLAIGAQVAAALDSAHAMGLVHRDVKPANILLAPPDADGEERAFLTDFGITKLIASERTTETGQFIGTIDYMAPEQIQGDLLDGRSDQYSLACVVYESLAGEVPFRREEQVAILYAHLQEAPLPLAKRGVDVPTGLDEAIRRGMAKRPDKRFDSCSEMIAAGTGALATEGARAASAAGRVEPSVVGSTAITSSRDESALSPDGAKKGRHREHRGRQKRRWATLAVGLMVAGTVGVVMLSTHRTPRPTNGPTSPGATSALESTPPVPSNVASVADVTWARVPDPALVFGGPGDQGMSREVATASTVVAVGYEILNPTDIDPAIWYLQDGGSWSRSTVIGATNPGIQFMGAVARFDQRFIAVGSITPPDGNEDGRVWTSKDGVDFTPVANPGNLGGPGDQEIRRIITVRNSLFAVGWDDSRNLGRDAYVWRSVNGRQWNGEYSGTFGGRGDQEMWNIAEFRGELVGVGTESLGGDLNAAVWTSRNDGKTWQRADPGQFREPGDQVMKTVVPFGTKLIALGSDLRPTTNAKDGAEWVSTNGTTWTRHPVPAFSLPLDQEIEGALTLDGGVVAVGQGGIWTSQDGLAWTRSRGGRPTPTEVDLMKGVALLDGKLIVVGHARVGTEGSAAVWIGAPPSGTAFSLPSPTPQPRAPAPTVKPTAGSP
jgi:serine/threonine-protein kinase